MPATVRRSASKLPFRKYIVFKSTHPTRAISHSVTDFPTYKFIDRDGVILDVNADPRNLESLAKLLEQMKPTDP